MSSATPWQEVIRPGEGFLEKWGRLNMSRFNAESDLMREMVLIEPEPGVE